MADGGFDIEVVGRFEVEQIGDDAAGELLALIPIVADVPVIKTARSLDAVFGIHQFVLQLQKLLVGF